MSNTAEKLCILMAWAVASALVCSFATPAMAEEGGAKFQVIMKVLDSANAQVHADIIQLQQLRIELPAGVKPYYSAAVTEHQLATQDLQAGNIGFAKNHAMKAMELYRTVSDLLADVRELESLAVIEETLEENIGMAEKRAGYLKTLAVDNNVSINVSDYQSVINDAKKALAKGELDEAEEKVALAESMIADMQSEIQESADAQKLKKAEKFVEKMLKHLSKIVSEQEKDNHKGDRDSLIDKLKVIANDLNNTKNFDAIMTATDDASKLQSIFRDYKAFLSDTDELNEKSDEKVDDNSSGTGSGDDNSGSDDDDSNSGSGNNENDERDRLKRAADDLEERAEELLDRSDNAVAELNIKQALELIDTAEDRISDDDYTAASAALSSAETLLDLAEELISS